MDRTLLILVILLFLISLVLLYFVRKHQIKKLLEGEELKRLKELDSQKTKLYTNFTHQFRTPLTVIQGMATRLIEDNEIYGIHKSCDQEGKAQALVKIRDRADMILRNAANLLQLVNQILDIAKNDTHSIRFNWERKNVVPFIQYLLENFKGLAKAKQINFSFNSSIDSLLMDFDRQKLQDIIFNLLSNAIKFTITHGEIKVSLDVLDSQNNNGHSYLQIIVFNTGTGIVEEDLDRIFDRFYQGKYVGEKNILGTGIGLAMTKELVEKWGGRIAVKSQEKLGAKFTVTLPLRAEEEVLSNDLEFTLGSIDNGIVEKEFRSLAKNPDDLPLVLLVEDNVDAAYYIAEVIREHYNVQWFADGESAIKKSMELVPDLIISDVMMPGMDGFELASILKNDFRTNHIPIVFLTARVDVISRLSSLEKGADAYLTKPFEPKELLLVLHNLLELRRKWQLRFSDEESTDVNGIAEGIGSSKVYQDAFLGKINEILEKKLSDSQFNIPRLCEEVNMSQSQLFRKVKALTGQSISAYICQYRLKRSLDLLNNSQKTISEIAYEVGFTSPAYFTRQFSKRFQKPPSALRK